MIDRTFDKFTRRAKRALRLAGEEAQQLNHPFIGTAHLVLGIMREGDNATARVLTELGVGLPRLRHAVAFVVGLGGERPEHEQILDSSARRVLAYATCEAERCKHDYVGTEHLLLGLVRNGECLATTVLEIVGVSLSLVQQQVERMLRQGTLRDGAIPPTVATDLPYPTPYLDQLGTNLTELAATGQLDPVIGRTHEIERMIQILARRTKHNVALVGDPGVGKTALVAGLAQRINDGQVPARLKDRRVVSLDIGALVAGTTFQGDFEDRLAQVVTECNAIGCILFIDELHTLIGAGGKPGGLDAANMLKPVLARGAFQTIGATTLDEYRRHIERDPALERRFQPLPVDEPSVPETIEILRGLRQRYETFHQLRIDDAALTAAAQLSVRYLPDRCLPDKAIDLIDEAAARVGMARAAVPLPLRAALRGLQALHAEHEAALADGQHALAADLQRRAEDMRVRMVGVERILGLQAAAYPALDAHVTAHDVAATVELCSGVPVTELRRDEAARLLDLEQALHRRVVGQHEAVSAIARALRRSRAGLSDPRRPIGSFLFLGPSGVGKTELARALAECLFGSEEQLIRIDMSEFQEAHTAARLLGAPPGYVGYGEGGQLTEAVRRKPYAVLLLDEIEKAHPALLHLLLQVLDDGVLTDGQGRRVDFRNTVVIMTSNIGSAALEQTAGLGLRRTTNAIDQRAEIDAALEQVFRPELLNRIDARLIFQPLTRAELREIGTLMLQPLRQQLSARGITLDVRDDAYDLLVQHGGTAAGARPLRRTITTLIEDPLTDALLDGRFAAEDALTIDTMLQADGRRLLRFRPTRTAAVVAS